MIERNYESFDDVIFYNAIEKNKNKAIKYVLLLSLTKGLKGNALKSYLQNLDVTVKGAKVNYKNILKARKIFAKEGKLGLLQPFYGERGVKICF
jgi:intergrase/recombinase